eukprot:5133401-Amphidinium_carterae.1
MTGELLVGSFRCCIAAKAALQQLAKEGAQLVRKMDEQLRLVQEIEDIERAFDDFLELCAKSSAQLKGLRETAQRELKQHVTARQNAVQLRLWQAFPPAQQCQADVGFIMKAWQSRVA